MKKKRLLTDRSGTLLDEIYEQKAKELANEIDANVLRGMLVELGWHEIVLSPMTWEEGYFVDEWVSSNVKNSFWTHGLVWMFKDDKDAMWFKLRWL